MSVTTHQKFTYREIPREDILNAPYNPRTLSDYARKKLRKRLETDGLVETLVWNARTGHLVSGHKRLELLDDIEGGRAYLVGVAVVDLSPEDERAQNVFFNNIYAQGTYDEQGFVALVQAGTPLDAMGFTIADLEQEFGVVPALDPTFATARETQAPLVDAIRAVEKSRTLRKVDERVAAQNAAVGHTDSDYSIAIVFRSPAERDLFAQAMGVDDRFVYTADQLAPILQPRYQWRPETPDAPHDRADVSVPGDSPEPDHAGALHPAHD